MFSKKATKFDKIFTDDLKLCSKCQIDAEDFINFCGLLRKHELKKIYLPHLFMAADDKGDMKVKLAKAAVTNRNISSPPFMRESPKTIIR